MNMQILTTRRQYLRALEDLSQTEQRLFVEEQAALAADEGGYWMNKGTGTVDTKDGWDRDFNSKLVEVRFNELTSGWEEV